MIETLTVLPLSFWVVAALLLGGGAWAATRIREGIGLPMLVVLGTVASWYAGDVLYNDYAHNHAMMFTADVLQNAWWQVAWFITSFLCLASLMHGLFNGRLRQNSSRVFLLAQTGSEDSVFQSHLDQLFWGAVLGWVVLVAIACFRLGGQIPYFFFPFLGERADPWGRDQIGSGISALLSLAGNVQLFLAAMFGVVAALARNERVRLLALLACCLAWPNFIFDRTRNSMLVIVMPGLLSWVFIRLRMGWGQKLAVLAVCFAVVNAWMAFVIANRSQTSIAAAVRGEGTNLKEASVEAHHAGLNMFEELCWINTLLGANTLEVNRGGNYWANLVNPIPRGLWKEKPLIGLDYAVARGQEYTDTGTTATMSTGLVGQGVINFGSVLGPAFAAWLMALWVTFLARLDLRDDEVGNLGVFQLGLVETFNLGRDVTFLALYPVLFGLLIVWWMRRRPSDRPQRQLRKFQRGAV